MLLVELLPESEILLKDVVFLYEKADAFMGNRMFTVLLDTRGHNTWEIPTEVLKFMAKTPYSKKHIAFAIVVDTIPMRMFSNLYLSVYQPIATTKVFSDRKKAEDWLISFSN